MKTERYERLNETIYSDKLENGLHVYVLPKPGFQKTYATFSTNFGSIDNDFRVAGGERIRVPDGIAHFLEHKMFEEPQGDVFARFASQGASANAFTSFDRTSYLFSATEHIAANVETLLNFVQNPYFTDANVEKEKGIIGQEIRMYQDHPDWRVYYGLIEALYQRHPVHIDIAGTVESISAITKELLYDCYNAFYHPSNMSLFIVGGVDPEEMMLLVRDNQAKKQYPAMGEIERFLPDEPGAIRESMRRVKLPVSQPKCMIGFKEQPLGSNGEALLKREAEMKLLLDMLFSSSSAVYQRLYDEDLITDSFGSEYNVHPSYAFSVLGGETKNPDKLVERIREEIGKAQRDGLNEDDFERSRKKKIGGFLRMLNSPEAIANEFTKYRFKQIDLFDTLSAYESMTLERVQARLNEHFDGGRMAVSIVSAD